MKLKINCKRKIVIIFFIVYINGVAQFFEKIKTEGFTQTYKCLITNNEITYLATDNGLYKYDGIEYYRFNEIYDAVYDLYEDKNNSILIITAQKDLFIKKEGEGKFQKINIGNVNSDLSLNMVLYEDDTFVYYHIKSLTNGFIYNSIGLLNKLNYKFNFRSIGDVRDDYYISRFFIDSTYFLQSQKDKYFIYLNHDGTKLLVKDSILNKETLFRVKQINKIAKIGERVFVMNIDGVSEIIFKYSKIMILYKIKDVTCIDSCKSRVVISTLEGVFQKNQTDIFSIDVLNGHNILDFVAGNNKSFYLIDDKYVIYKGCFINNRIEKIDDNSSGRFFCKRIALFDKFVMINGIVFSRNSKFFYKKHSNHLICDSIKGNQKYLGVVNIAACEYNSNVSSFKVIFKGCKTFDIKYQNNRVYIATQKGLYIAPYNNIEKNLLNLGYPNELNNLKVVDLEKKDNEVVFALAANRIFIFKDDFLQKEYIITSDKSFEFTQMKVIGNKYLVLSSISGVMVYLIKKDKIWNHYCLEKLTFVFLPQPHNSDFILNNINSGRDRVYLATNKGVFCMKLDVFPKINEPVFSLSEVNSNVQDNIIFNEAKTNLLAVHTNSLIFKFNFTPNIYSNYYQQKFRFRLISKQSVSEWVYFNQREFDVINLRDGSFMIQLQFLDNKLEWVDMKVFKLVIPIAFYKMKIAIASFFLLIIFGLGIVFYSILQFRKGKLLTENYKLMNQNFELEFMKSQMNPHFIYNSLNSLKGLIYLKSDITIRYIDDLAVFFRSILKITQSIEIEIMEELKLAESYIRIENIRLNGKIKFSVIQDKEYKNYLMPCNILQPILENAIKYGNSEEDELLQIFVLIKENEGCINIDVLNNGKIVHNKDRRNISFALDNIGKRLDAFNKKAVDNPLEICDICDEQSNFMVKCGIKFKIKIYENINN